MSASELLKRLQAMPMGEPLNWTGIRKEIHDDLDRATTLEERTTLLALFTAIMDLVERNIANTAPENLEKFRTTRLQDYRLLLIKEAMVGVDVCVYTMNEVTEREVAAGRMSPNDELRLTALQGVSAPHHSHAELIAIAEKRRTPSGWRGALRRIFRG